MAMISAFYVCIFLLQYMVEFFVGISSLAAFPQWTTRLNSQLDVLLVS